MPSARGVLSGLLVTELAQAPHELPAVLIADTGDPLSAEDLQLALYLCYELHYRGLPGVDERWEWDPSLLALRAELEEVFERALRAAVPFSHDAVSSSDLDLALREIADDEGPSLSSHIRSRASLEQIREF